MDPESAVQTLKDALADPALASRHAEIQAALNKHPTGLGETIGVRAPPPEEPPDTLGARMKRGAQRLGEMGAPVASFANRALNTATFGLADKGEDALANLTGVRVGDAPAQREDFQKNHPWAAGTADAIGYMAPEGLPGRVGKAVGRGVDELTQALARRGAQSTGAGRVSAKMLGSTAASMGTAGAVRGSEALVRGDSPEQAGREALDAATSPLAIWAGAGFGMASGAAAEGAAAARRASPDISVLARHRLEPGPIPGRPVISMDQPILKQLPGASEPPLGVSRATPGTRGAASRQAGDVIREDMNAREKANNQQYGKLFEQKLAEEGGNPAQFKHIVNQIDTDLSGADLSDETRQGLLDVRKKFEPFMAKPNANLDMIDQAMRTASPANKAALQATRAQIVRASGAEQPQPFTAADLNEIRQYAGTKVGEGKISGGDQKFVRLQGMLKDTLGQHAPGLAELNATHHDLMNGFEQRRALLGESENPGRGPYAEERQGRAIAGRIRQGGEESGTAGGGTTAEGHSTERLSALGAPPTHPGAPVPPFDPNYRAQLEVPRLQLAQEGIQLMPGHAFSAAGGYGERGMALRLAQFAPTRVAYPLARRLGDSSVGTKPIAADALIQALQRRTKSTRNWQTDEDRGGQ
jgi:hypothetical protein